MIDVIARARGCALACAVALAACGAWAQPAKIPLEAFFQNPSFGQGRLSPNGRFVGLVIAPPAGRTQLVVFDIEKRTAKLVAGFANADIGRYEWVNDDRLVYTLDDRQVAQGDVRFGPGLFAVDRDGTNDRELAPRSNVTDASGPRLPFTVQLFGPTRARRGDDVFVLEPVRNTLGQVDQVRILRVDTKTGRSTAATRPGKTVGWLLAPDDVPRIALTREAGRVGLWYLDPATDKWRQLADHDAFARGVMQPVSLDAQGNLLVLTREHGDKLALHRYDLKANVLDPQPIVAVKDFDFIGSPILDGDRVVGVHYTSDAGGTLWLDDRLKQVQARVDAALPGTVNRISLARRPELPVVLVTSWSDHLPGKLALYDTDKGTFTELGSALPRIDPAQMADRDLVRMKARDGLEIPAWLTLPRGAKGRKVPMVVLLHGGPWLRGGEWRWEAESQFLASRGYAVLEPEFRGSLGYGYQHFRAGWKQWGLAMQDDVADATRWAIAQGIADPARVCIAGASYGGYATLMGLIRDPDLFKCGVDWAGVTDPRFIYDLLDSDTPFDAKIHSLPVLLGDPEKDAAQMKATSPLEQAARIRQPLLLAYGGADRRVPIEHGLRLKAALERTNPNVEWIEYKEEGHGWALVKTRVDFWTRVEKFLARNIGSAP